MNRDKDDMDESSNRIAAYLDGRMTPQEAGAFEVECQTNPELAEELADLRLLYVGLTVVDQARSDHIDSERLALYAEQPSVLDASIVGAIESHLETCPACREELRVCRQVVAPVRETVPASSESRRGSEPSRPVVWRLRPAFAIAATILLMFATWLTTSEFLAPTASVESFEISSGVQRSRGEQNHVAIASGTEVVRLEFLLPTIEGRFYNYTLVDSTATPIMTSYHHPHQMPVAFDIPAAYLGDGSYTIWVIEDTEAIGETGGLDSLRVQFSVEFVD